MAGRPKLNKAQQVQREADVWALRVQGWTERRIAAQLGVDHTTVHRILVRLEDRVLKETADKAARVKVQVNARQEYRYSVVMRQYRASIGKKTRTTHQITAQVRPPDENGRRTEISAVRVTKVEEEVCHGDLECLREAARIEEAQMKLWGLMESGTKEAAGQTPDGDEDPSPEALLPKVQALLLAGKKQADAKAGPAKEVPIPCALTEPAEGEGQTPASAQSGG